MAHVLASGDADGVLVLWDIDEAKPNTVIEDRQNGGVRDWVHGGSRASGLAVTILSVSKSLRR